MQVRAADCAVQSTLAGVWEEKNKEQIVYRHRMVFLTRRASDTPIAVGLLVHEDHRKDFASFMADGSGVMWFAIDKAWPRKRTKATWVRLAGRGTSNAKAWSKTMDLMDYDDRMIHHFPKLDEAVVRKLINLYW